MIIPSAIEPVTIKLYLNTLFKNNYNDHFYRPNFTKNGVPVTRITYKQLLDAAVTNTFTLTGTYNFNYNNGLATSVILEVPTTYLSSDYMVVNTTAEEYYYFITNVVILNHSATNGYATAKFELELDVLATYELEYTSSLANYPINVERKHCQRFAIDSNLSAIPYCSDLILNENELSNPNPNVISKVIKPTINVEGLSNSVTEGNAQKLKDIYWYYFLGDSNNPDDRNSSAWYRIKNISSPLYIGVMPCLSSGIFWIRFGSDIYQVNIDTTIKRFFESPYINNVKISPYPPFSSMNNLTIDTYFNQLRFNIGGSTKLEGDNVTEYQFAIGNNRFSFVIKRETIGEQIISHYSWSIGEQNENSYPFTYTSIYETLAKPTVDTNRNYQYEIKAQFNPYKKYVLKSQYGDAQEIHPEIIYATNRPETYYIKDTPTSEEKLTTAIYMESVATAFVPDMVLSTYVSHFTISDNQSMYFKDINKGYINSPNYTLPSGSEALTTFEQTQGNSFAVQKISQVVGGVISGVSGMLLTATGNPLGVVGIAGGVTSIGLSGGGALAKYNDLANTPDTISTLGATAYHDNAVGNTLFPYVCVYELTPSEKEIINDYFYDYGYNVQRCCKFNLELYPDTYNTTNWVDERIFTRNRFNYVKINEDITNKIRGNIPPIVKKKISDIFNNGIRLWSFINCETVVTLRDDFNANIYRKTKENAEVY